MKTLESYMTTKNWKEEFDKEFWTNSEVSPFKNGYSYERVKSFIESLLATQRKEIADHIHAAAEMVEDDGARTALGVIADEILQDNYTK